MSRMAVPTMALFLLAPAAAREPPQGAAPGRNVLERYLDRANVHPPVAVGRLTVFPISLSRANTLGDLLTMQQALKSGLLIVEELPSAQVDRARFINKSSRQMIFLMAGELIAGGKQNRTLATDALLGPNSTTDLPLYCVQKGRWDGPRKFSSGTQVVPQAVRGQALAGAGQKAVWDEVRRANARLRSSTASEDLSAAMARPENVRQLSHLRGRIVPSLPSDCVGVVVAWAGRIVGADLFNHPQLFAAMRGKVLDSYFSEYGMDAAVPLRPSAAPPSVETARQYLLGCYRARFDSGEMRGVGRIHHIRGERHGQTLAYHGVYPLREEVYSSRVRPSREYMIHTALTPQVVPVRPRPVPLR